MLLEVKSRLSFSELFLTDYKKPFPASSRRITGIFIPRGRKARRYFTHAHMGKRMGRQVYVSHSALEIGLTYSPATAPRDNRQKDRQPKAKRMRRISKEATKEGATSPQK